MLATAYMLFALSAGNLPVFTALAAYSSEESCKQAATVITAALSSSDEPQKLVCFSAESLAALGKANGLGE